MNCIRSDHIPELSCLLSGAIMTQILALDIAGNPFRWLGLERAISYTATGKVAWAIGAGELVFYGGIQRSGERRILADQMEYLAARLPKHSRALVDMQ